jgi:signal transduction histidine kinase
MSKVKLLFIENFLIQIPSFFTFNKIVFLFCLFLISGGNYKLKAQSQSNIDSLKGIIVSGITEEEQVENYNLIAYLFSSDQPDSALFYAEKSLALAEKINDLKGKADAHFQLSYYYDREGDVEKAIMHVEKACDLYISLGDSSYLSGCYNNLGVYYSYGTEQTKSLEYFIKALNTAESLNDTFALSEAFYNIGTFYEYVDEYGMALQYYLKALEIDTSQNDIEEISWSYINLGNINMKLNRYDEALKYLVKAKNTSTEIKDQYINIHLNLSFAYYFLEKSELDTVEIYINKAREIYEQYKFDRLQPDIISIEADLLMARNQSAESIKLYNKAIDIYDQQNTKAGLSDIYESRAKAYENIGNLENAYLSLQKANELINDIRKNEIAKVLGEFEQKEATKEQLKQLQLEQQLLAQTQETDFLRVRANFRYALLSIVFILIFTVLALYMYIIKRKNNRLLQENIETINQQRSQLQAQYYEMEASRKELSELNATKDKFFSILAHDLKNPFNTLMGLSEVLLNNKEIKDSDQYDELIEGIHKTASSGYNLLENLLEWSRSQTGNIKLDPQSVSLEKIITSNIHFFHEDLREKKIETVIHNHYDNFVFADSNMVNFIVRNLLNNAIKFSYPGGKIELSVEQKNDFYVVNVRDYGIGMNPETIENLFKIDKSVQRKGTSGETGTGLGLILCKEFVAKNDGEIWVESTQGEGSRFSFSLPVFDQQ